MTSQSIYDFGPLLPQYRAVGTGGALPPPPDPFTLSQPVQWDRVSPPLRTSLLAHPPPYFQTFLRSCHITINFCQILNLPLKNDDVKE